MNVRVVLSSCMLALCAIATFGGGQGVHKQRPKNQAVLKPLTPPQIAQRATAALVSIQSLLPDFKTPLGYGSGFCIGQDPFVAGNVLIATNYHVLKGGAHLLIRPVPFRDAGEVETYWVVFVDEPHDIALLSAKIKRLPLPLALALPAVGDTVYVMGNPKHLEGSFSSGLVSGIRHTPSLEIQITAPISPGNSGGPVLNALGQVIGIATWTLEGQNLNFAVSSRLINVAALAFESDPHGSVAQAKPYTTGMEALLGKTRSQRRRRRVPQKRSDQKRSPQNGYLSPALRGATTTGSID